MKPTAMLIDGEWVRGGTTFDTLNPDSGSILGQVYQATLEQVNVAVEAANRARSTWKNLPISQRAEILTKFSELLLKEAGTQGEKTPLKQLITDEMGKRLPEADIEVFETADMAAFFAKSGPKILRLKKLNLNKTLWPTKRSHIVFEPLGVVAVIKPWNYPLELPIWSIASALISGNTVVFKPSEYTPLVGLEIGRLFEQAGLPPGVLNVVTGDGEVGKALVEHTGVHAVSFTGSVRVGREIAQSCASQLKRCSLELGGNDSAIVGRDADLELTANGLVWGAFCNSGQVCVGVKRALVEEVVHDRLLSKIVAKTAALRPGVDFGPMVSKEQVEAVEAQVKDAVATGAEVVCGGRRLTETRGYYYAPTVLTGVPDSAGLITKECFGPVLPIQRVKSVDEAVEKTNASEFGLGASIWTGNREQANKIARALDVGMAWINDVNVAFPEAPWGGAKSSGLGVELSEFGLLEFVQIKHINAETSGDTRREWWYPYPPAEHGT